MKKPVKHEVKAYALSVLKVLSSDTVAMAEANYDSNINFKWFLKNYKTNYKNTSFVKEGRTTRVNLQTTRVTNGLTTMMQQ